MHDLDSAPRPDLSDPDTLAEAVDRFVTEPAHRIAPFDLFKVLHAEAPIYKTRSGTWLVTGYDAMVSLLRGDRLSRWDAAKNEITIDTDADPELNRALTAITQMMINRDEPDHARLRKLVRHAFLPSSVAEWSERIQKATAEIIDRVIDKREFDLVSEVAFPLPEIVICELLGVPHEDHVLWSQWSHDAVAANRTPAPTGENLARTQRASKNFYNYFKDLTALRRKNLGDDLISVLLRAEEDGDKLTEDELIGTVVLLIQAGQETTANLIANGMCHLMRTPELYESLIENPSLTSAAVEEMLRRDSPAFFNLPRKAKEDIDCGGVTIRKGDYVMICPFAANQDPSVFSDPQTVDFGRDNLYKHVAFGVGIHTCIGRQFALLEANIMFDQIMKRLPHLELAREPEFSSSFTRGYKSVLVRNRDVPERSKQGR